MRPADTAERQQRLAALPPYRLESRHVRREDMAEPQEADRINEPRDARERQECE